MREFFLTVSLNSIISTCKHPYEGVYNMYTFDVCVKNLCKLEGRRYTLCIFVLATWKYENNDRDQVWKFWNEKKSFSSADFFLQHLFVYLSFKLLFFSLKMSLSSHLKGQNKKKLFEKQTFSKKNIFKKIF